MKINDYLNSLLKQNYFLEKVVILGPYPSAHFIDDFINGAYNKRTPTTGPRITLVIDDGWDQQEVDAILERIPRGHGVRQQPVSIHRASTLQSVGLVHAKIYYFEICNRDRTYTKRHLLIGSANASKLGFGVHAETFISIDLSDVSDPGERTALENYIESLNLGADSIEELTFSLGHKTWVRLPAIKFVSEKESGFDAWLRGGRLCYKYQPEQTFGKIRLALRKPLPKSALEKDLNQFGFGQEMEKSILNRNYAGNFSDAGEISQPRWRAKYFVETYYGHWASGDCYACHKATFVAPQEIERARLLSDIATASESKIEEWLLDYKSALNGVKERLLGREIREYFDFSADGSVSEKYLEKAAGKIEADRIRARDENFRERFISGYAFVRVPQLGDDYEEFALDFCRTLILMTEKQTNGALAQILKRQFPTVLKRANGDEVSLLALIREDWRKLRSAMTNYYQDTSLVTS